VRGTTDGLTISNGKSYGDPSFDKLKKLEVGKESFSEMLMRELPVRSGAADLQIHQGSFCRGSQVLAGLAA
jgi:predicted CopG family antitoxin